MGRNISLWFLLAAVVTPLHADGPSMSDRIGHAMQGDHRSQANVARNRYRHPVETLTFLGVADGLTVMEIWPGAGWYTEVLAPAIRDKGKLIVAGYDVDVKGQPDYRYRLQKQLLDKFAERPDLYDQVQVVPFSPPQSASLGSANSVDVVLTFRSVHNWVGNGIAESVFSEFFRVLKPGGILGVVQHRAPEGSPLESAEKGYVAQDALVALAVAAGFWIDASSEVNANPKDLKDHAEGVWTLPPSLALGEVDRDKYLAIGESDRMTVRFRKPN